MDEFSREAKKHSEKSWFRVCTLIVSYTGKHGLVGATAYEADHHDALMHPPPPGDEKARQSTVSGRFSDLKKTHVLIPVKLLKRLLKTQGLPIPAVLEERRPTQTDANAGVSVLRDVALTLGVQLPPVVATDTFGADKLELLGYPTSPAPMPRPKLRRPGSEETPPATVPTSPQRVYPDMSNNDPLITRHRPGSFAAVCGNIETVAALQRRVEGDKRPHAYLFTGPSGVGKTTLARIIGTTLGAEIIEVDAASNSGVDAMRELVELGHYMAPGAQARLIIIDECHRLSRNAWDAMLKVLEEPPEHLYLALCTTEYTKVPDTIATRCHHVKLYALPDALIGEFLIEVLTKEGWDVIINDDVFQLVVQESLGSPRRALALAQAVYDVPNVAEAKRVINLQGSASPLIQVLQILMSGQGGWGSVRPLLAQLDDDDFSEAAMIMASRYIIGAMNREENDKRAAKFWELLAAFLYPVHSYDPRSVFYGAVGRILWERV